MSSSFLQAASIRSLALSSSAPAVAAVADPIHSTPKRCGELHCQKESYAKSLRTVVLSCAPMVEAVAPAKGKKKNDASPPAQKKWAVVLADTVLFPEGGGQPTDSGTVGGVACEKHEGG